jgi:hypothetical protein
MAGEALGLSTGLVEVSHCGVANLMRLALHIVHGAPCAVELSSSLMPGPLRLDCARVALGPGLRRAEHFAEEGRGGKEGRHRGGDVGDHSYLAIAGWNASMSVRC